MLKKQDKIKIDFLICNTARSGTNLLSRYLNGCADGIKGISEWFSESECKLERCRQRNSKQIGTIVHGRYLSKFLKYIRNNGYNITSETKFIHLTRHDKIRQAISKLKFNQSYEADGEFAYDKKRISENILRFCSEEHIWIEFFKSHSIRPLHISYEELDRFPRATLEKIVVDLGTQLKNFDKLTEIQNSGKLSNEDSETWVERYLNDM